MSEHRRVDRVAATGAGLGLVMTFFYIWLMRQPGYGSQVWDSVVRRPPSSAQLTIDQGIHPWQLILVALLTATALASYGARITSLYRRSALLLAGVVLTLIGMRVLQVIGFIGAPIFLSGLLGLVAAARRMRQVNGE